MAHGIRAILAPIPTPQPEQINAVLRVRVSLTGFGAGQSQAPDIGRVPATLKLFARYLARVQPEKATDFELFASLTGQVELRGPERRPVFVNDADSGGGRALTYEQPIELDPTPEKGSAEAHRPRRVLGLEFAAGQFENMADSEGLNENLVLPQEPDGTWHHAELQAELEVAGAPEAELGTTGIVDIPLFVTREFPISAQKPKAVYVEEPPPEPILLADASDVIGGPKDVATDATPPPPPPPPQIARFKEGPAAAPAIQHDHGFLDDGNGNIDSSKYRDPTVGDHLALTKWRTQLAGAQLLRADLVDATDAYEHYLFGGGTESSFSYERFVAQDASGRKVLRSAVDDAVRAAVVLHQSKVPFTPPERREDSYSMVSDAVSVGAGNRYPYPATENWQKAIGGHAIWLSTDVKVVTEPATGRRFDIVLTLHAEDMYNFNPGAADIATGAPDSDNGRFQVSRLAYEFMNRSQLTRTVTIQLGPCEADSDVDPADIIVSNAPIVAPPAAGATPAQPPPPSP
ncbi:MAG: hypothetical protein JW751_17595 [Polyangiaceae bacterium]|nr:hypothetical protein [Polyangiaceae bacterium]